MQVFFNLSRVGIDGARWSKRKFDEHVTSFLQLQRNVQFYDLLEAGTGWDAYTVLIDCETAEEARALRAEVERRCKLVASKCRPYYFRSRVMHVDKIGQLNIMGLTVDEHRRFQEKAPPGVKREIAV